MSKKELWRLEVVQAVVGSRLNQAEAAARILARSLSDSLGQQVVLENKAAASV
ncbi:MAG: tripartite tricarboxylate transporter substrate-binding protein [Betaproteobacteria bacterium]|nr:tripartite tricarboxylate transporter substrate-binding protein [Betaproteobacteria bacterium]